MTTLRYTLLSDGSSDKVLLPILTWLINEYTTNIPVEGRWADLRMLPRPPKGLAGKIVRSIELYPCDILFVHRDSENAMLQHRKDEIQEACTVASRHIEVPPTVCVIPIRMQEAWLLFDIYAIRAAASNPNGRVRIQLPTLLRLEELADPKTHLHQVLRDASELQGRRLKDFNPAKHAHRVSEHISDFSPLRALSAFQVLEQDVALCFQD